jgi:SagB-type dehydrogenase family enzyme
MVNIAVETVTLSLADGAEVFGSRPGTVEVRRRSRILRFKLLDPGVEAALIRLADSPAGVAELEKIARTAHPEADLGRLTEELVRMLSRSFLRLSCVAAGAELMRATATSPLIGFDLAQPPPAGPVCLSRFAYTRRLDRTVLLESPVSHVSVEVLDPALGALVFGLATPSRMDEMPGRLPGYPPEAVRTATAFLLGLGLLVDVDASGRPADETQPHLAQREFHDVLAHAAGRRGLTDRPLGGTFRFESVLPPQPAIRPLPDGPRVPLPQCDIDHLAVQDPPLTRVMESRRSIRKHGSTPITATQLGEFLYRVARVKKVHGVDEAAGTKYETSHRTYPAGGACYDLELYVTTRTAAGLAPGIYHYDPAGHQLTLVCNSPELVRRMLLEGCMSAAVMHEPQVLITLASRFARLSWKYEGIAYAITLKNVGVLYEAMYLVATAMGLAPCALGGGDAALFSTATGLDPMVESSVGEFLLGTMPTD